MQWFFEQVAKEMKAHPITLMLVIGGMVAIVLGYAQFATAGEVGALKQDLQRQEKVSTCRWLSDKIDDLEVVIFNLEKDEARQEWINEKKRSLNKLRDRYKTTTCSTTGY